MATFRKKRSRQYRRRNTRRNIRRNTRRKYIKARKSSINRHSRKSLEGGLFFTRRSAVVAPAPYDRPQKDSLSISGESNNIGSLLPHEDKTSSMRAVTICGSWITAPGSDLGFRRPSGR